MTMWCQQMIAGNNIMGIKNESAWLLGIGLRRRLFLGIRSSNALRDYFSWAVLMFLIVEEKKCTCLIFSFTLKRPHCGDACCNKAAVMEQWLFSYLNRLRRSELDPNKIPNTKRDYEAVLALPWQVFGLLFTEIRFKRGVSYPSFHHLACHINFPWQIRAASVNWRTKVTVNCKIQSPKRLVSYLNYAHYRQVPKSVPYVQFTYSISYLIITCSTQQSTPFYRCQASTLADSCLSMDQRKLRSCGSAYLGLHQFTPPEQISSLKLRGREGAKGDRFINYFKLLFSCLITQLSYLITYPVLSRSLIILIWLSLMLWLVPPD